MNTRQNQAPAGAAFLEPGLQRRIASIVDRGDEDHLVPGTRVTMDELHRYQLLGRQLQARAVAEALGALFRPLRRAAGALGRARREGAAIRALGALDDHFLADIGITRDQIPAAVAGLLDRQVATNPAPRSPTLVPSGDRPAASNDAHGRRAA